MTTPVEYAPATDINTTYHYIDATESLWGTKSRISDDDVVEYQYDKLDSSTVTLESIVDDLCDRADIGSSDYDASELGSTAVRGYMIANMGSARSAIETLRRCYLFDGADTGAAIEFRHLGQTLDRTLDGDDIGAHTEGQQQPALVTIHREQEVALPSELSVNYIDAGANYEVGSQIARRQASRSVQKASVDLPVVLTYTEAAQKADVLLHLAHIERENYETTLMPVHSDLIPSDVIAVNDGTSTHRMRVTEKTLENGYLSVRGVRDEASVLSSSAAGAEIPGRDTTIATAGLMQTWILNLPALRDQENTAGFYAAGFSYTPGWPGGALFRSTAGEWANIGAIPNESTAGYCNNAFDAGVLNRWDHSDELEIDIMAGDDLASDTAVNVLNGANVAAWGVEGRYEIIQWVTATQQADGSWVLSQLLRGRFGTEQYTDDHEIRDRFAVIDLDTTRRFTMQNSEIGNTAFYRGVTIGRNVYDDSSSGAQFTHDGRSLECWAPVDVEGSRGGGGTLTIIWKRRDRVIARPFWDPDMSESTEAYEIDILDGVDVVRTITGMDSETGEYTAGQQTTDFGSTQSSIDLIVYQVSSVVGRGFGTEATL